MDAALNERKEKLFDDLKAVLTDVEALLSTAADTTHHEFDDVRAQWQARVDEARKQFDRVAAAAGPRVQAAAKEADAFVSERPWTAIAVVAAASFLAGVILGRR